MPRKRACKDRVINYYLSDSDDDDDYRSSKVAKRKHLVQEEEQRNKHIKYYISSDSDAEEAPNKSDIQMENINRSLETDNDSLIMEVRELVARSEAVCAELMQRSQNHTETTLNNIKDDEKSNIGVIDLTNVAETIRFNTPQESTHLEPQTVVDLSGSPKQLANESAQNKNVPEENKKSGLECPICLEELIGRQPKVTPCGHYFCQSCVRRFGSKTFNCPTCRKKCKVKSLYQIYL